MVDVVVVDVVVVGVVVLDVVDVVVVGVDVVAEVEVVDIVGGGMVEADVEQEATTSSEAARPIRRCMDHMIAVSRPNPGESSLDNC